MTTVLRPPRHAGERVRRGVDLLVVIAAAAIVLPLLAALAAAIRLDTPGPIFIRHRRLGRGGKTIQVLKLRTMVRDAEERKRELAHLNVLPWPDFKIPNDPRITRVGRWLRKTSLDELPQLWNLLRGDVTLVGPRPCSIAISKYELWQTERLEVTPGLFGRWQAEGRGVTDFATRCRMDIAQIRNRSVRVEVALAAKTMASVVHGTGAS
jgi:lipopolysaccharide/colanic/teichoic acid biosynthesis glycosyltransferase